MKRIKLMQENEEYIPINLQKFANIYKPKKKPKKNKPLDNLTNL